MSPRQELIEAPLSSEELGARYRALCEDPMYAEVPGKFELDIWGRVLLTPPRSNYHGILRARLAQRIARRDGEVFMQVSVVTAIGVCVADVAWASADFRGRHKFDTPFTGAPELCIDVVSPSNSVMELSEKRGAYLAAGAREVWIVYPQSKRCEFHGPKGLLESVDLTGIFD
jgi:Uma2 family endonuclease